MLTLSCAFRPQQLSLNAVQEHVLEENMDVFSKSGFVFSADESGEFADFDIAFIVSYYREFLVARISIA